MKQNLFVFVLLLLLILPACSSSPSGSAAKIEISGAYVSDVMALDPMGATPKPSGMSMPGMGGSDGAGYMLIKNSGGVPDKLLKVESDAAATAELHQNEMKGDVMSMSRVDALEIPANGQAELKPGGYHLMLTGLKQDLMVGSKIKLTLTFEKSGKMNVDAEVKKP